MGTVRGYRGRVSVYILGQGSLYDPWLRQSGGEEQYLSVKLGQQLIKRVATCLHGHPRPCSEIISRRTASENRVAT